MSWTLSVSGAAIYKAGKGCDANLRISGAILDKWSDEAEGQICTTTRKDWVSAYGSLNTTLRYILSDAVSDLVAMRMICYSMSGYTSRYEAQTMLDVLRDNYTRCIEQLKLEEVKEKM